MRLRKYSFVVVGIILILLTVGPVGPTKAHLAGKHVYWEDFHDTNGDSILPGGNLYDFATELTNLGASLTEITTQPIDYATLSQYDILVLNDPESALSPVEIQAIWDWLEDCGHGMFVIGEWINAFDVTSVNTLSAPYGVQWDTVNYLYGTTTISNFASHPITAGITQYSDSAMGILRVVDYPSVALARAPTGEFVLAAKDGNSRIVWITDSDMWQNTKIGYADNLQLGINIMTWLSEASCPGPIPLFSDILAMLPLGIVAGAVVIKRRRKASN